ncbi:MAG: DUF2911 domain-containing protein [Gemmatimonadales bacterium]
MILASTASLFVIATWIVGGSVYATGGVVADTACIVMNPADFATRRSPLDSVTIALGGGVAKVCYGRPSARGRKMIGSDHVPFGSIWRTGANEPAMIHTTIALDVGNIHIGPGTYSLYTVPGEKEWEVIVNRSTSQWGAERNYTDAVRAQEVGRTRVSSVHTEHYVETFTIRAKSEPGGNATMVLEWENTRVEVPLSVTN